MHTHTGLASPQPERVRLITLDALRGFALLGILVPNIVAFALPMGAATDPALIGPGAWNRIGHEITVTVFLGKFMFIFAMLFGAGVVMFDRKTTPAEGQRPRLSDGAGLWYRRCGALLALGLVHAYLFWYGDILTWYAVAGLTLLWWVRKLPAAVQVWGGLGLYFLGGLLLLGITALGLWAVSEGQASASDMMGGDPTREIVGYTGSWWDAFKTRFFQTIMMHLFLGPVFMPGLWGIMVLGMGLTRAGVLTGERSMRFHLVLGVVLTMIGGVITAGAFVAVQRHSAYPGFLWQSMAQLVGVPLAIGYSQLVIAMAKSPAFAPLTKGLANIGRMALSNYLLHTVVFTTLMYGYGFGLFGRFEYPALFGLVVGMWAVNFVFSALWLRRFRYGPVEWAWRQLTYLGLKPSAGD